MARSQHGVITREQLEAFGLTRHAIRHRIERGRLHPLWPNTYAVGRPDLTREGLWLAAVLSCGEGAALSHASAAALCRIRTSSPRVIEVSVPAFRRPRRRGIAVHRRRRAYDTTYFEGIPVTTPAQTIIDIAGSLTEPQIERAIDEADKHDLVHPRELRHAAEGRSGSGAKRVRELLDRQTFVLTRSELERIFLPLAARAGLSRPETQARVGGFDVDFHFAKEGLVVETDGGRFHRTAAQQTRDRRREHAVFAAELIPLRFTHAQVKFEPDYVVGVLKGRG